METITNNLLSFDLMSQYGTDFVLGLSMQVIAGILTIFIGFWLSGRASRFAIKALSKIDQIDKTIIPMIGALVRYAGMTLTLVVALGKFGVETTSIIAVLGAAGLAIGLALQGTLSNVASGFMLLLLRPFSVGDWIETNGISGTVKEIGLFATQIDTFENIYITLPNSSIWSATIINNSRHPTRRMDLDIGIGYDSNLNEVEKAFITCINAMPKKQPSLKSGRNIARQ